MRIPTGVRTPLVDIMSIRALAGAVHALVHPGRRLASSSFATSSAIVSGVSSGHASPSAPFSQGGAQFVYQRDRLSKGHSDWGLRRMVVSTIEYGAGSVAVSARPTLPKTVATSGN